MPPDESHRSDLVIDETSASGWTFAFFERAMPVSGS